MPLRRSIPIGLLALWVALHSLVYPEISFTDGSMQNAVVDLATALVEWRSVELGPLWINTPDTAERDGRFYSGMGPGVSWLAVPAYLVARAAARHLPPALDRWIEREHVRIAANPPRTWPGNIYVTPYYKPQIVTHMLLTIIFGFLGGAAAVLLVDRLARGFGLSDPAAVFASAAYALGTPMIFYHASYYTQSVALLLLLCAMNLLLVNTETLGRRRLLLGGLCLAWAGTCDYPYFLYALLVALVCLARAWRRGQLPRTLLHLVLGGALPCLAMLIYHHAAFGSILNTPYGFRYRNPYPHHTGLYGIVLPTWPRIRALLIGWKEGLLTTAPVLLLAVPGLINAALDRRTPRVLLALAVALVSASAWHFISIAWPSTTAAYGPRFFLPGLLGLALLAGFAWPAWRRIGVPLLGAGFLINALHIIGIGPWDAFARSEEGLIHTGPHSILLFPLSARFSIGTGLLTFIAWLITCSALVFLVGRITRNCKP